MIKETVVISLDTFKHMEKKIDNLEQSITDLKIGMELVSFDRGSFPYKYWFFNPSKATIEICEKLTNVQCENEKLRAELKRVNKSAFERFFRCDW